MTPSSKAQDFRERAQSLRTMADTFSNAAQGLRRLADNYERMAEQLEPRQPHLPSVARTAFTNDTQPRSGRDLH